jgi:hypothetical protein
LLYVPLDGPSGSDLTLATFSGHRMLADIGALSSDQFQGQNGRMSVPGKTRDITEIGKASRRSMKWLRLW